MKLARSTRWSVAGLALLMLLAGGLPARAGEASWADPADDANAFYILAETPLPNNDALDVVNSTVATKGADMSWVVKMKDMPDEGYPDHATGYFVRLGFTYADTPFEIRIGEDQLSPAAVSVRTAETPAVTVPCEKCTGVIDRKTDSVVLTAPVAALAAGMKGALPDLPPFGPGAELTTLYVTSQRYIGAQLTMTADEADAPEGTAYTV